MVEVLKQPPYQPLPIEKQVVIIYAGANGYLDDMVAGSVVKFEAELYPFIESKYPEILEGIRSKQKIDDEVENKLKAALEDFKSQFSA
jgi:F-type H+-transporting ATPase subunit alpha